MQGILAPSPACQRASEPQTPSGKHPCTNFEASRVVQVAKIEFVAAVAVLLLLKLLVFLSTSFFPRNAKIEYKLTNEIHLEMFSSFIADIPLTANYRSYHRNHVETWFDCGRRNDVDTW